MKKQVTIMMGSKSDLELMQPASNTLKELGIGHEVRIMSAHRTPARTADYVKTAVEEGVKVFICAAGAAAHLAGAVAAHTTLPVIGVPLARTPLGGNDSLYSTVQMPSGMPVATVAIDGAVNAAILAAQMLSIGDQSVGEKIVAQRETRRKKVIAADESMQS